MERLNPLRRAIAQMLCNRHSALAEGAPGRYLGSCRLFITSPQAWRSARYGIEKFRVPSNSKLASLGLLVGQITGLSLDLESRGGGHATRAWALQAALPEDPCCVMLNRKSGTVAWRVVLQLYATLVPPLRNVQPISLLRVSTRRDAIRMTSEHDPMPATHASVPPVGSGSA